MTKDKALKLALEAGYKDLPTVRLAYQGFDIQHFTNLVIADERHRVLTNEREALVQPDTGMAYTIALQRAIEWHCDGKAVPPNVAALCPYHSEKLNETLAQPVQPEQWTPEDTAYRPGGLAQAEQEPVAWMCQEYRAAFMGDLQWFDEVEFVQPPNDPERFRNITPLYAAPFQREWVGLTDEEVDQFHNWKDCTWSTTELVRYVEFKLREKNA